MTATNQNVPLVKLGDIAELITSGATPAVDKKELYSNKKEGIPFFRIQNIGENRLLLSDLKYITSEVHEKGLSRSKIRPNDVLLTITGRLGTATVVPEEVKEGNINQHICLLRLKKEVADPEYIAFHINSRQTHYEIAQKQYGTTRIALNHKSVSSLQINLPSLKTQKTISSVLRKATNLQQKREEANQIANKLLQAVFLQMFGDPQFNPYNWNKKRMVEIAEIRGRIGWRGMTTKDYRKEGPILIGVTNIRKDLQLDLTEVRRISRERYQESPEIMVKNGDVLLAKSGATTGKSCVVEDLNEEATVNAAVNVIRARQGTNNYYLNYFIATRYCQSIIGQTAPGSAQPNLFQRDTKKIEVPIPPIELQNYFATVVQKMKAIKENQKQSTKEVTSLFDSLMSKAFKGEMSHNN